MPSVKTNNFFWYKKEHKELSKEVNKLYIYVQSSRATSMITSSIKIRLKYIKINVAGTEIRVGINLQRK